MTENLHGWAGQRLTSALVCVRSGMLWRQSCLRGLVRGAELELWSHGALICWVASTCACMCAASPNAALPLGLPVLSPWHCQSHLRRCTHQWEMRRWDCRAENERAHAFLAPN
jgi:hypothetical protein